MNLCGPGGQEEMQAQNRAMRSILADICKELARPGHARKRWLLKMIPKELRPQWAAKRLAAGGEGDEDMSKCPTCGSREPHRHPALQYEGEVEVCCDDFHLQQTPQNKPEYIESVLAKREMIAKAAQP